MCKRLCRWGKLLNNIFHPFQDVRTCPSFADVQTAVYFLSSPDKVKRQVNDVTQFRQSVWRLVKLTRVFTRELLQTAALKRHITSKSAVLVTILKHMIISWAVFQLNGGNVDEIFTTSAVLGK